MADLNAEQEWAKHMPSEGEQRQNVDANRTRRGVDATAQRHQKDAQAAPTSADPQAAESNREFVEDIAMEYNAAEEANARKGPQP